MGLQEMPSRPAALYLMTLLNIFGQMEKRRNIVEDVFSKYFINALTKDGWAKITDIFLSFNTQQIISTSATPSKDFRTSDSTLTQFSISQNTTNCILMWNVAKSKHLFVNDTAMNLLFIDPSSNAIDNQAPMRRWAMLISAFETIYELQESVKITLTSIYLSFKSKDYSNTKSPGQLLFFGDQYSHGSLFYKWETLKDNNGKTTVLSAPDDLHVDSEEPISTGNEPFPSKLEGGAGSGDFGPFVFAHVPWDILVELFADINTIVSTDINDLWYMTIPKVEFDLGLSETGTFGYTQESVVINNGETGPYDVRMLTTTPLPPENPDCWNGGYMSCRAKAGGVGDSYYKMYRPRPSSKIGAVIPLGLRSPQPNQFVEWKDRIDYTDEEKFTQWCQDKSYEFFTPHYT